MDAAMDVAQPDAPLPDAGPAECIPIGVQLQPLSLPEYGDTVFETIANSRLVCRTGQPAYSVMRVDDDDFADLLVHQVCGDSATGTSRWLIHPGGESGFGAATDHRLPSGYGEFAFEDLASPRFDCAAERPAYTLVQFDPDGRLDLLVHQRCGSTDVGTSHWLLHRGEAGGFADTPTMLTLPAGYGELAFEDVAVARCERERPAFALLDVTGDGYLDLVVYQICGDNDVGTTHWLVHPGSASGFGAGQQFSLPDGYGMFAFENLAEPSFDCGDSKPAFALMELDGAPGLDLVVYQRCGESETGTSRWLLHAGSPTGVSAEPVPFAMPEGYGELAFQDLANPRLSCRGERRPGYGLVELNGDDRLDLVVHQACGFAEVGTSEWRIHLAGDGGFEAARSFALPEGFGDLAFEDLFNPTLDCGATNRPVYSLFDYANEGTGILVTSSCFDLEVGDTRWDWYRTRCE